jgi:hypothetical protein
MFLIPMIISLACGYLAVGILVLRIAEWWISDTLSYTAEGRGFYVLVWPCVFIAWLICAVCYTVGLLVVGRHA